MKTVASSLKRKKDESNIDLTPMLDVVFILLIFFVVTASFLKESAIDIQGQQSNNSPPPPSEEDTPQNILIQITDSNQLFFNQERIDISAVRARVASHRAENPAASVIIRTSPNSSANVLVTSMNSAREAGALNISVSQ